MSIAKSGERMHPFLDSLARATALARTYPHDSEWWILAIPSCHSILSWLFSHGVHMCKGGGREAQLNQGTFATPKFSKCLMNGYEVDLTTRILPMWALPEESLGVIYLRSFLRIIVGLFVPFHQYGVDFSAQSCASPTPRTIFKFCKSRIFANVGHCLYHGLSRFHYSFFHP